MEEVTARVYLVSISRSRYSAVYVGGHAKTALLHAAISAAAHQMCEMLMNVQFRSCRDERSELNNTVYVVLKFSTAVLHFSTTNSSRSKFS